MVSHSNVQDIFACLSDHLKSHHASTNLTTIVEVERFFFWLNLIGISLGVVAATPLYFNQDFYGNHRGWVANIFMSVLYFAEFTLFINMITIIISCAWSFIHNFKNPLSFFFEIATKNSETDLPLIYFFKKQRLEDLKYALLQIKSEKNSLAIRIVMLAGPVVKVGVIPVILGLLVAFKRLSPLDTWIDFTSKWYVLFLLIALLICWMNIHFSSLIQRLERGIALLELAISDKLEKKIPHHKAL